QGPRTKELPPYISLNVFSNFEFFEHAAYLGQGHKPFSPSGRDMANLRLHKDVTLDRLADRRSLLGALDSPRRDLAGGTGDLGAATGSLAGMDRFTAQALDMVVSPRARAALDLSQEPDRVRERYGPGSSHFLLARRLVEAGVRVVTLSGGWAREGGESSTN